ncbi:MAG: putative sulfate exporter family transporter [Bdellovibrio sp.]|nr:putative sulfate exporter family transporter [Bdellovibrio sp.]
MKSLSKILFPVAAILSLAPFISSGVSLLMGVLLAVVFGNPYLEQSRKLTQKLLPLSVVGLGAGMNLHVIGKVGLQGVGYTIVGISCALLLGTLLGKLFKTSPDTSLLVTVGTAICGGSAIAAVAPVIRAKSHEVSVSLGVVFLLNSLALFIFPAVGHYFHLSEVQFGLWSALAIHDTSSVVGAAMQFGHQALEVGTTVKLARALWIVPVAFAIGLIYTKKNSAAAATGKAKKPWFILGFLLAATLVTYVPELKSTGDIVNTLAKRTLVLTLFLIGTSLTRETIRNVGAKPFLQGVTLWILVASGTLGALLAGWIH